MQGMYISCDRHSWNWYFTFEGSSSSQSTLHFHSCCMINFGSIRLGEAIPRGSKMEQSKLSNPRYLILSSSVFSFHKIPRAVWVDYWSLCSATAFLVSISVSGN